jgi:hypothetical protein
MAMTIVEATRSIVGAIDTHSQVHVAAALGKVGGLLGSASVVTITGFGQRHIAHGCTRRCWRFGLTGGKDV